MNCNSPSNGGTRLEAPHVLCALVLLPVNRVVMLSSAQPLNHIYVTMSKQAHTCTLWVQGSSILIKDDGAGTDTENKDRGSKNC